MNKLSELRNLFKSELGPVKGEREAEQLFFTAAYFIDGFERKDLLLDKGSSMKEAYLRCLQDLKSGMPIQYHFGKALFCDLALNVSPDVLIPRPETEELVHWVEELYDGSEKRVLDVGTGSGCIALAIKQLCPNWNLTALDVSEAALAVAKDNARLNGLELEFIHLDILKEDMPSFDILLSNPPYIPYSEAVEMDSQVVDHEPSLALFCCR